MRKQRRESIELMVINCLQLGMDIDKAYVLAEATDKEIGYLEANKKFNILVQVTETRLIQELLESHKKALTIAVKKGNTKPVEWMLSKLNPDKWDNKTVEITVPTKLVIDADDKNLG